LSFSCDVNVLLYASDAASRCTPTPDGFSKTPRPVACPVRGNLVPDAHLAALLRQHGVRTLYTREADFRKFAFLEIRDPFA